MLVALIIALLFGGYAAPPEPAEGEQLPVPVLMYHKIDVHGGGRYNVSPSKFRKQLEELRRADYYLINISDLVEGRLDQVPAGKHPVVLTFDDSDDSHLRFLHNGRLDPNCAAGVLERFCEKHPDFGHGAAFFCLAGGERASFFNDYLRWEEKLVWLLDHGYEIGNHTTTHPDLSKLTPEEIVWEIGTCQRLLEQAIGELEGYLRGLCYPYGAIPLTTEQYAACHSGELDGFRYEMDYAVAAWGGLCPSPELPEFGGLRYRIPRIEIHEDRGNGGFDVRWLTRFARTYTSNGTSWESPRTLLLDWWRRLWSATGHRGFGGSWLTDSLAKPVEGFHRPLKQLPPPPARFR